ncbi:hypothetical protein [Mariniflexile sp. AS56]|uniref:hypothetical protein n=1 Tax=Mariniflexile sp. AS56 TaxID=3063957 RepID=UPI0026EAE6BE|nr:hypothetical protein [Mariniflexile sp. AS56]MDO7172174.1 hypothetical protein [Mariniflexile sp. AS56]
MQRLTELEIEALYNFTKKHFVEWYDVQTELVDHLANGIEEQWEEKPNLTFDDALKIEFKKFGVFGFSEIVEEKTSALEKYYRKEVWNCLKEYFKFPKIILTFFSVWALFKILQLIENTSYVAVGLMVGVLFYYSIFLGKEGVKLKKIQKKTGKKWLFENVITQLGGFVHLLNIGIYMPIINFDKQWDALAILSFSGCLVIYSLLLYVSIKVVSPKLKAKFSKEHPEYKFL